MMIPATLHLVVQMRNVLMVSVPACLNIKATLIPVADQNASLTTIVLATRLALETNVLIHVQELAVKEPFVR